MKSVVRALAACLFAGQFVLLDVVARGTKAYGAEPRVFLALAASAALGSSVLFVRNPRARALLAAICGAVFCAQGLFIWLWHLPIDRQVARSALYHAADVGAVVRTVAPWVTALFALAIALEIALVRIAPLVQSRRARIACAAALAAALLFGPPLRRATPEIAALDALSAFAPETQTAQARTTRVTDAIPVRPGPLPNVVFILTESVRASDACAAPNAPCETMPAMHALVPDRAPLHEMRAVSSYTAVSLSALLTGRTQTGDRRSIVDAPTMFELVRSVRAGETRPYVAFWSAQMASVFERNDVVQSVDSFVSVETLLGEKIEDDDEVVDRGVDRLLVRHAMREIDRLPRPFFLFLQLAGTHAPYFVDEAKAPFSPWSRIVGWSKLAELHRAYRNAIHAQDAALAELLQKILRTSEEQPLVVLYTSDHGEAFGEHGAIHHGQNLYDEQIHVPAWITARGGALAAPKLSNVKAHERTFVTHLDLLPTVLDIYGAWGSFGVGNLRRELAGESLLSPVSRREPVPITNCTTMFPCPLNAWGVLSEERALLAQVWDPDWRCLRLGTTEPFLPSDDPACAALRVASRRHYEKLPNGSPNR